MELTPSAPIGWEVVRNGASVADRGLVLYVARGCASCHGLGGTGTSVGSSVLGASERKVTRLIRDGSGGMPVYHPNDLSDQEIQTLAGYIASLGPAPTETPIFGTPTATPWPSPTPTPAPKPTPTPIPTPSSTPEPGTTPTPTPVPTVSDAEIKAAQQLYIDVGCDICHGKSAEGGEKGPELKGFTAEDISKAVREGIRNQASKYPREMERYTTNDLTDEELEQLVKYLLSLK